MRPRSRDGSHALDSQNANCFGSAVPATPGVEALRSKQYTHRLARTRWGLERSGGCLAPSSGARLPKRGLAATRRRQPSASGRTLTRWCACGWAKNWALRCFVRERLIAFLSKLDEGSHLPHDRDAPVARWAVVLMAPRPARSQKAPDGRSHHVFPATNSRSAYRGRNDK